jgi:hypothetical protein
MPIALEDSSRGSSENLRKIDSRRTAVSDAASARDRETREANVCITRLLLSAPVDLAAISDEIRRYPDLEALILRLGTALAVSPDEPVNTVEEAVVVLGTHRLRVMTDLWSSTGFSAAPSTDAPAAGAAPNLRKAGAAISAPVAIPEARYLTNFLRCMGFDSQENVTSASPLAAAWASKMPADQVSLLTDIFMRDFFSLLPMIRPGIQESAGNSRASHQR